MWEKFKSIVAHDQIFASVLIVLVGIVSFGLGRLGVVEPTTDSQTASVQLAPEPFIIEAGGDTGSRTNADSVSPAPVTGRLVASKSGSRYHLLDCPSASQIKESNKVYFASEAEAQAAGYTKAANCPGL